MRHHYVPQFLLGVWADGRGDGRFLSFQIDRPGIPVTPRRPRYTGFEEDLWALDRPNVAGMKQQAVEKILFRQIDNNAASVRQKLVDQGLRALTRAERSDWVRFLMSLRIRQPDLIREIVADSADGLRASLESQPDEYEAIAGEGYPPTLVEWANGEFPGLIENSGLSFLHELVAVEKIGEKFFGLKWWLWDFGDAKHELLLSDNPCIFTGALDAPNLIVALPISPTRAFLASRGMRVTANIRGLDSSTLATRLNFSSVLQARARVYSRTAGTRRFIENQIYGRR